MTALARTALSASAIPLAGDGFAVTWRDAVDGTLHTAYTDTLAGVGAGYAVARGGKLISDETETEMELETEETTI